MEGKQLREINKIFEINETKIVKKVASKEVITSFSVDNVERHITVWVDLLDDDQVKIKSESYYFGHDVFMENPTEDYLWGLIDEERDS